MMNLWTAGGTASRKGLLAGSAAMGLALAATTAAHADAAIADLVEEVGPSVVTILAEQEMTPRPAEGQFGNGSPFEEFFRQFGPEGIPAPRDRGTPRTGLGSGFILEEDGLIVTNHHVVDGASEVTVRLEDGREFDAEIVGVDPQTDLALIRIEVGDALPYVTLGDSDEIRVGEDVVAIGNPFGLGGTVTSGIISAKGRNIGPGPYAEFLQTDAAINKGNSGGPLFNMEGEVVGVNSAIFSPSGGSVGVGFAVTSNVLDLIVDDLLEDGKVDRGWLGVSIQTVTPELAEAMDLEDARGALVSSVIEGSPAEGAIEVGDVIVGFDGTDVDTSADLPKLVAAVDAGETAEIRVIRGGRETSVRVEIGQQQIAEAAASSAGPAGTGELGVTVAPLTKTVRAELGLDETIVGVVVTALVPGGPASEAGLQVGDVIMRVGDEDIASPKALKAALDSEKTDPALMLVNRQGRNLFLTVDIA